MFQESDKTALVLLQKLLLTALVLLQIKIYGGEFIVSKTVTSKGKAYLLMNMPYYLGTKLPDYIAWFVENNIL